MNNNNENNYWRRERIIDPNFMIYNADNVTNTITQPLLARRRNAINEFILGGNIIGQFHYANMSNILNDQVEQFDSFYQMKNASDNICNICMEELQSKTKIYIFDCFHFVCEKCFKKILPMNVCPTCRKEIKPNEFIKSDGKSGLGPKNFYEMEIIKIIETDKNNYDYMDDID